MLSAAYELAGADDRRAAHLATWLRSGLPYPERTDLVWLGSFRAAQDGPEAGIEVLRQAWSKTRDLEIAVALSNLLLAAGKLETLAALTAELAGTEPAGEGKEPPEADLARLLRARGALVRQGPEAALPEYQAWIERASYLRPGEAEEYLSLVAGVRGAPASEGAARELCARELVHFGSAPSECAATLLAQFGQSRGALQLLEAAAQRAPENLRLQTSYAQAAEQAGSLDRAEAAYRHVLAADPKSEIAWTGLGHIAELRKDLAGLEAVLGQAERVLGERPLLLVFALARTYRTAGQAARAVEILTALRERQPAMLSPADCWRGSTPWAPAFPGTAPAPWRSPGRLRPAVLSRRCEFSAGHISGAKVSRLTWCNLRSGCAAAPRRETPSA